MNWTTVFKPNFTLEDANAGHVERHAFPFEMQEDRITPGKAVIRLMVLHDKFSYSVGRSVAIQWRLSVHERKPWRQLHELENFVDVDVDAAQHDLDRLLLSGSGKRL